MSESRFMKTVLFGGYDREGVEQKFERLSAKLFELENELSENRSLLASVQNGGDEAAALRDMLEQVRGELSKVQAKQETAAHRGQRPRNRIAQSKGHLAAGSDP